MGRLICRTSVVVVFAVCLIAAASGRATAAAEYCGASVVSLPIGGQSGVPATVYALRFSAKNPRTVSGTVMLKTTAGWFATDFASVPIESHPLRYVNGSVPFTRTEFFSPNVYVAFPEPVAMLSSYVAKAAVADDTAFGWDGAMHACYAYDASAVPSQKTPKRATTIAAIDPPPPPVPPAPASAILKAVPAPAPSSANCPDPFSNATVTRPVPPQFPLGYMLEQPIESLIEVTVSPSGELDDAEVYAPSGIKTFDQAALTAARASTYKPARAFCQSVPGDYLFRAQFRP